jgi:hypothetical protein
VAIRLLHFVAIMFAVVSISKVDLRLMSIAEKWTPVTELLAEILPWTWGRSLWLQLPEYLCLYRMRPVFMPTILLG